MLVVICQFDLKQDKDEKWSPQSHQLSVWGLIYKNVYCVQSFFAGERRLLEPLFSWISVIQPLLDTA